MRMRLTTATLIGVMLLATTGLAGEMTPPDREAVLKAINEVATYAVDVLISEEGYSKCDYNVLEGKWYPYEPAWHTGQLIYALVEAYKVTGNEHYLDVAKRAGDWWISLRIEEPKELKGMLRTTHGDIVGDFIVFSTMTDGSAGIYKLSEATGDKKYADIATEAGDWMMKHMWNEEYQIFYDAVDPATGKVLTEEEGSQIDRQDGNEPIGTNPVFRAARPNTEGSLYMDMYQYTGKKKYKKMFITMSESSLNYEDENGLWMKFVPNYPDEGRFHARMNMWYAESLLEAYDLTSDEKYLDGALRTIRTYADAQEPDGLFYYVNYTTGKAPRRDSITGSATAFLGLLALRAVNYGHPEFQNTVDISLDWIMKNRYASDHPDPNLRGAVLNSRVRTRNDKVWETQRDVGTSFGLRFLCDVYNDRWGSAEDGE